MHKWATDTACYQAKREHITDIWLWYISDRDAGLTMEANTQVA